MRREQIFLPSDIRVEEVTAMAAAIGCFVRYSNGFVFMDRVPGIISKDAPENLSLLKQKKRA